MLNQMSDNNVKLTREQYHTNVEVFSHNPPVNFRLPKATWRGLLIHANEIVSDAGEPFFLKSDAARMIISYYFYKSMDRVLAKYPSLSGYAQVLENSSHPDFPTFTQMFLGNESASVLIPQYVQDGLNTAPVIYNELDDHLMYPTRKVKSKCA